MKSFLLAAALTAASALSAMAADLTPVEAFAFETAATAKAGAAYITIRTDGDHDRLIGAASPAAKRVEIHTHLKDGDVMRMRRVEAPLPVSPGAPIEMGPGGVHIMLMGLTTPLTDGAFISVTLTFETAGEIVVEVPIIKRKGHGGHSGHKPKSD